MKNLATLASRLLIGTAITSVPMFGLSNAALAQETVDGNETEPAAIVVTGTRFRGQQELRAKDQSDVIIDTLSADEVSSVPDFNIADAFRRIAGVSAEFDEDEGRFINIRGVDSNLNYVTIDGLGVPTTGSFGDGGRNVDIEFLPSTAVKSLEVVKSFTPDIDGSSIGGYANIVTRSAFDRPGFFLVARATASHYAIDNVGPKNRFPIRGEVTLSDTFGTNEEFGFTVTGLYAVRPREQHKLFLVNGFTTFPNIVPPDRFNVSLYDDDQTRYGANAKFEYRGDRGSAALSGYWYVQQETETRYVNNLGIAVADVSETSPTTGRVIRAQNDITNDYFPIGLQGKGFQFNAQRDIGDRAKLSFRTGWSEQNFDHDTPALAFRAARATQLGFTVDTSDLIYTRTAVNDPAYFADPSRYTATLARFRKLRTDESVFDTKLDFAWNTDRGDQGIGFKVGGEYRQLKRTRDNDQFDLSAATRATLRLADFLDPQTYNSRYQPEPFLFISTDRLRRYFNSATLVRDVNGSTNADFRYQENILAGYGMATFRSGPFYFAGGVRYERTRFDASAASQAGVVDSGYEDWLPSAVASIELADGLKLRGGASKSLGRPNPSDLTVTTSVTNAADDAPVDVIVSRSNPDLKPRRSTNFDLSLEYYFNKGEGLLSAAVFQKDIKGDIFQLRTLGTFEGQSAEFRQNINALSSRVKGLELSAYLGNMPFLPAPLDGFGISGNITFIDGRMIIPNGQNPDLTIITRTLDRRIRQPDLIANAALFYSKGGFEARVAYNVTDKFLLSLTQEEARYEQVDASVKYDLTDNFQISLQGRNLLGADRRQIASVADFGLLFGETDIGPSYHLSVSFKY